MDVIACPARPRRLFGAGTFGMINSVVEGRPAPFRGPPATHFSMRKLRFLLLLTVALVVAAVVWDFQDSRRGEVEGLIQDLKVIPSELAAQASRWHWSQSSAERQKVEIFADSFRQSTETHLFDLEGVELRIFHENGKSYDQVISGAARFDSRSEELYSEGKVTLILGRDIDSKPDQIESATRIHSSGVTFEATSGVCVTDRPTVYEFEGGSGRSVGAFYDSVNRFFRMDKQVYVRRDPLSAGRSPLEIRSRELHYYEVAQRIDLIGAVSLTEGPRRARAEQANVYLDQGEVRRIEMTQSSGQERQAGRTIGFEAGAATLWYGPRQVLEKIVGRTKARLRSVTESSSLTAWGERLELAYTQLPGQDASVLREADLRESAGIETGSSRADPKAGVGGSGPAAGSRRRVRSEWIHLTMRRGGEEVDRVETLAPGTIELIPGAADQWRRRLSAKRVRMLYGDSNRMKKLLALGDVAVVSTPPAVTGDEAEGASEPLLSWSDNLEADFDDSGEAVGIKQWENFRFQQGTREGRAKQADIDLQAGLTRLSNRARIWDQSGSVNADTIVIEEGAGRMEAHGNVSSMHRERASETFGKSDGKSESLFSSAEPVLGAAENLVSEQEQGLLRYRGKARLWQGANRIEARDITIDRHAKSLAARGDVRSVIGHRGGERSAEASSAGEEQPVWLSADSLDYDEVTGKAVYRNRAKLIREDLTVWSDEIEGLLGGDEEEGGGAQLQVAFARGRVRIHKAATTTGPERQGFGHEAEYRPAEDRVELSGAPARLRAADGRETRGVRLTYDLGRDRVLVRGDEQQRVHSYRPNSRPTP